jgi:Helix-turn-helix domain
MERLSPSVSEQPLSRRVYTVAELAVMFGTATDAVYRAIHSGKLKPLAGFGRYMFSDREIEKFLGATK